MEPPPSAQGEPRPPTPDDPRPQIFNSILDEFAFTLRLSPPYMVLSHHRGTLVVGDSISFKQIFDGLLGRTSILGGKRCPQWNYTLRQAIIVKAFSARRRTISPIDPAPLREELVRIWEQISYIRKLPSQASYGLHSQFTRLDEGVLGEKCVPLRYRALD